MFSYQARHRLDVIIGSGERLARRGLGHARTIGKTQRRGTGPRLHQQMIGVAVVAPFEFEDDLPVGKAPRHPDGTHHGFRAGTHESNLVHGGERFAKHLSQFQFLWRRRAVARPRTGSPLNSPHHRRMGMSQDHGPPRGHIIQIRVAVHVGHRGPLRAVDEQRMPADRPKRADRAVHPAGNIVLRADK